MKTEEILRKQDLLTLQIIGELANIQEVSNLNRSDLIESIVCELFIKKELIISMRMSLFNRDITGTIIVLDDLTVTSLQEIFNRIKDKKENIVKTRAGLNKHIINFIKKNGAEKFFKKVPEYIKKDMFALVSDADTSTVKALMNEAILTGFANLLNRTNTQILKDMVKKISNENTLTKKKELINFLLEEE
ncbi:hypothetical protein ENU1_126780 [Entamoeba nuttalli P19]|uniref:Uncharacterized protein n=1 Tax=Entamoeba nuttalli (strain P19) TaxID=1076696 RepID=K2GW87_ENTNP|nr:hypothetical protein ENU1_126780 [Entamoeba nuttalli P19]EKE39473.1 hypothetical protein ENU1_126780 [Entamoeba nuttalli P19]|eukprot:XP_008858195.1 hypothetical protein ENU1_126780 [Entamoeba nuttalli P19]